MIPTDGEGYIDELYRIEEILTFSFKSYKIQIIICNTEPERFIDEHFDFDILKGKVCASTGLYQSELFVQSQIVSRTISIQCDQLRRTNSSRILKYQNRGYSFTFVELGSKLDTPAMKEKLNLLLTK